MMVGPESVDNLPSVASEGEARASLTLPHSKGFERAQARLELCSSSRDWILWSLNIAQIRKSLG